MIKTARKIRRLREQNKYSQEYMAHKLNISQPAYAKIDNGATKISIERLIDLASIFEIDPQDLLEGEKTINQYNNETAYGFVENLYQEQKEIYEKLISQLENENKRLIQENNRLRSNFKTN